MNRLSNIFWRRQPRVLFPEFRARKDLIESINKDAYGGVNIFEGTEAMPTGATSGDPKPGSPLGDIAPNDPGVNIDGIMNIAGDAWGKFI